MVPQSHINCTQKGFKGVQIQIHFFFTSMSNNYTIQDSVFVDLFIYYICDLTSPQ